MQVSRAAPQRASGWQRGQACGGQDGSGSVLRKNHNAVEINRRSGALRVAATEPVCHPSYLLNPRSTCWRWQKDEVPSVLVFCLNINSVVFMSFHIATQNLWDENVQSLADRTLQGPVRTLDASPVLCRRVPRSVSAPPPHPGSDPSWNWSETGWSVCSISWCCSGKLAVTLTMLILLIFL